MSLRHSGGRTLFSRRGAPSPCAARRTHAPGKISTTKTGEERRVGIGARTAAVLKAHKRRQLEERMVALSWQDPGLVFPNTKGKVRRRDSVMRSLRRLLAEAGLPAEVRFHDLRHTARPWPLSKAFLYPRSPRCSGTGSGDDAQAIRARPRRDARRRGAGHGRAVLTPSAPLTPLTPRRTPTDPNLLRLSATARDRKAREFPGFIGFAGQ